MLKEERLETIQDMMTGQGIVRVSELTDKLQVTEMTIRRDLKELEEAGMIERIHGGAKAVEKLVESERSHYEKQEINIEEKIEIAKKIASMLHKNDTVFLGTGTTLELVFDYLEVLPLRIITNSYHTFEKFKKNSAYDLILVGGSYRVRTGAFVGSIANQTLSKFKVKKAFIGVNAINDNEVYTSNEEEGVTQGIVLDNAKEKYIVADYSKIDKEDFYSFYNLDEVTGVVTDSKVTSDMKINIEKYTAVLNGEGGLS
ncbi:DeoR/GlpR family DNA-binding transcription regulator [Jeotgalibaca sp. MA1X17-3]|uniref:DeoR/GlpR family DNA-binding transcription regulator n=1 Tax=Jeotgalibaca sp. MA1X17-3 TaxID=2908211 RepID=UPI001F1E8C0B|nr:DeoR/GlpR family DNA-binding transcription regulator [Jeotgalibaca sp. MA1X17-3]UJF16425.1 DeoR/GlpR family DNA-binding transcription regulator [Jeotgalibaca sp. MA1X17-3]